METTEELVAYLITSKWRRNILECLSKKSQRPKEIEDITKIDNSNISKTLLDLKKHKLVKCLTPEKKSWRVYAITDLGKEVVKEINKN